MCTNRRDIIASLDFELNPWCPTMCLKKFNNRKKRKADVNMGRKLKASGLNFGGDYIKQVWAQRIFIKALLHTSISIINHHSKNNFPSKKHIHRRNRRLLYKGIQGQKGRSKNRDLFTNSELLHLFDGKIQGEHKASSLHVVKTINTFSADLQVLTDARPTKREFLPAFHSFFFFDNSYMFTVFRHSMVQKLLWDFYQ